MVKEVNSGVCVANSTKITTDQIEKRIAKLYIFFLPIRLFSQLDFLKSIVSVAANYMSIIFHIFGLMYWLLREKSKLTISNNKNSRLFGNFCWLIVYLNLSSILMACVIQLIHGSYAGETAFSGIAGIVLYMLQFLLMFLYNIRVFSILTKKELRKVIHIVCVSMLVLGYVQVAVMNGVGGGIYDALDIFNILQDSNNLGKLCLTGTEGASAGSLIGILIVPFLLSEILVGNYKMPIIELVMWLIPIFFTHSSTVYIIFIVDIVVFLILSFRDKKRGRTLVYWLILLFIVAIIFILLVGVGALDLEFMKDIRYLLFEKASDFENGSTISRAVPFITNWGAFTEYPIFGVGNGLQGYFYIKYFPEWAFSNVGSDVLVFYEGSKSTIVNGGVFIPSLLSGYGIVGCVAIIAFIIKFIRLNKYRKEENGNFYYMFILGAIAFIFIGFQGNLFGVYYAWFVLSLPFIPPMDQSNMRG